MKTEKPYNRNEMIDSLIVQYMFILSELQDNELLKHSDFDYIQDDLDYVKIMYLGEQPDSDSQTELHKTYNKMVCSQLDALHILQTRLKNTLETL